MNSPYLIERFIILEIERYASHVFLRVPEKCVEEARATGEESFVALEITF